MIEDINTTETEVNTDKHWGVEENGTFWRGDIYQEPRKA